MLLSVNIKLKTIKTNKLSGHRPVIKHGDLKMIHFRMIWISYFFKGTYTVPKKIEIRPETNE